MVPFTRLLSALRGRCQAHLVMASSVTRLSKKHLLCRQYIHTGSQLWTFLERTDNGGCCVRSPSPLTSLPLRPPRLLMSFTKENAIDLQGVGRDPDH